MATYGLDASSSAGAPLLDRLVIIHWSSSSHAVWTLDTLAQLINIVDLHLVHLLLAVSNVDIVQYAIFLWNPFFQTELNVFEAKGVANFGTRCIQIGKRIGGTWLRRLYRQSVYVHCTHKLKRRNRSLICVQSRGPKGRKTRLRAGWSFGEGHNTDMHRRISLSVDRDRHGNFFRLCMIITLGVCCSNRTVEID